MSLRPWTVERHGGERPTIIVIRPEDDLVEHGGQDCECKPFKSLEREGPHVCGAIIVHNALDGRP